MTTMRQQTTLVDVKNSMNLDKSRLRRLSMKFTGRFDAI